MKKFNKVFSVFLSLSILLLGGCSNFVGLGEAIDQKGPVIEIVYPELNACVTDDFVLTGYARDNKGVTEINIRCEETGRSWKIENGIWVTKRDNEADWTEVQDAILSGYPDEYSFQVPIKIDGDGTIIDYSFDITATDKMHNTNKSSKVQLKVAVDKKVPVVNVLKPALTKTYAKEIENQASYTLENNSCLNYLINGLFIVQGSQDEDNPKELSIYLDDGKTSDPDEENTNLYAMAEITDSNVLRNWSAEFNVADFDEAFKSGIQTVRVTVVARDKASQENETKVLGWFTLWPEADKPWVSANFGDDQDYENSKIYPNYNIQGQAYDDDGLREVLVKIYSETGTLVKSERFDLSTKNEPYYSWSLKAPSEKGNYYAVIEVIDMNSVKGNTVTKYFNIKDTNPPSITIFSPESGESILGDESGYFTIKGTASDDGEVKELKVVKIAQGKESTQLNYLDATSNLWNGTEDSDGNKVYTLLLSEPSFNEEKKINTYEFSKTFNLFTDFGVDGTANKKASNQLFIFLAKDKGNESIVKSFSISGDTEAPKISIDTLTVNYEGNDTVYQIEDNLTLPTWHKSNDKITDKVSLSGTWSDNSFDNWKSLSKINNVLIEWAGVSGITVTMNSNGTWSTNSFTPANSTTASITASLTDFGGNNKKAFASFYIESNIPEWNRISSSSSDGSYKTGSEILITMEFNKSVKFQGGASDPEFILNNGQKAVYCDGNGTSKHYYKYTVKAGDDIADLDVTSLVKNGNTWSDDSTEVEMTLPAGEKSLGGGRNITIDTAAPEINSLSVISAGGSYKAGKSVFASLTFSEKVSITNVEGLKLKLNSGSTVYAENATVTSDKTVMFTYVIEEGQNASPLAATSVIAGSAVIKDMAGNVLSSLTLPSGNPFSSIIVDTAKPAAPQVTLSASGTVYSDSGVTVTVTGESGAKIEYSIDGGTSWSSYTKQVTLKDNSNYSVTARQTDNAGNLSDEAAIKTVSIDKGPVLTGISSTKTDGTYTYNAAEGKGDVIPVTLTFRKKVNVSSGATVTLNTTPVHTAVYNSAKSTDTVKVFEYTVSDKDSCNGLEVTAITGKFTDESGVDVSPYCTIPSGNSLLNNRTIKVVTGVPVVQSVTLSGTDLTISFNEDISKNDGEILITQSETDYRAPAVLSTSQYLEFVSKDSTIAQYYESGTNGASSAGVSDTSEKYILKYFYDSNDSTLCTKFKNAGALKVSVPVSSSSVTVNGTKLVISLTGSYKLPVLGASYTVSVPANLVIDALGHLNEKDSQTRTVTLAGVEPPAIRINKSLETITNGKAVQPMTAGVKMDCQTPGSSISYTQTKALTDISSANYTITQSVVEGYWNNGTMLNSSGSKPSVPSDPKTNGTAYKEFTIGSTTDYTNGYKVLIRAKAKSRTSYSEDSYEYACRSVVRIEHRENGDGYISNGSYYIRGGDLESGGVTTPGFPFSWDTGDFSKVRLMTKYNNYWYFITWNINVNAYFGIIEGDVPDDVAANGPLNWCWGTCAFVSSKAKYPVYPGEGVTLTTSGWSYNWSNGTYMGQFAFQGKQQEHRDGGWAGTLISPKS